MNYGIESFTSTGDLQLVSERAEYIYQLAYLRYNSPKLVKTTVHLLSKSMPLLTVKRGAGMVHSYTKSGDIYTSITFSVVPNVCIGGTSLDLAIYTSGFPPSVANSYGVSLYDSKGEILFSSTSPALDIVESFDINEAYGGQIYYDNNPVKWTTAPTKVDLFYGGRFYRIGGLNYRNAGDMSLKQKSSRRDLWLIVNGYNPMYSETLWQVPDLSSPVLCIGAFRYFHDIDSCVRWRPLIGIQDDTIFLTNISDLTWYMGDGSENHYGRSIGAVGQVVSFRSYGYINTCRLEYNGELG